MIEPSASVSAAALHLLLATHPEIDDLPIAWGIDVDRIIRPFITVDHPQAEQSMRLLAAALELDLEIRPYGTVDDPKCSLRAEGRWGGAGWLCLAYVHTDLHVTAPPTAAAPVPADQAEVWQ